RRGGCSVRRNGSSVQPDGAPRAQGMDRERDRAREEGERESGGGRVVCGSGKVVAGEESVLEEQACARPGFRNALAGAERPAVHAQRVSARAREAREPGDATNGAAGGAGEPETPRPGAREQESASQDGDRHRNGRVGEEDSEAGGEPAGERDPYA